MVLDLAGTLWVSARRPNNVPCVLAFRSDGVPPRAALTSAPGQVSPNGTWQVKVRGLKRFAPDNDRRAFLFSWRFDDQPWTAVREFPSEGLPIGGLKSGPHTFQGAGPG